jgi:hypothetical protein
VRTTIVLDDDVYQAAMALARGTGKTLGAALSELARRGLRATQTRKARRGVPVFDVRRGAKVIPGDRARDLLAREGLD